MTISKQSSECALERELKYLTNDDNIEHFSGKENSDNLNDKNMGLYKAKENKANKVIKQGRPKALLCVKILDSHKPFIEK